MDGEQQKPEPEAVAAWQQAEAARREFGWLGQPAEPIGDSVAQPPRPAASQAATGEAGDTAGPAGRLPHEPALLAEEAAATGEAVPWFGTEQQRVARAAEERRAHQAALGHFVAGVYARAAVLAGRQPGSSRPSGDVEADTSGEIAPQYAVLETTVGQLLRGDLVLEPRLGAVRVLRVEPLGYDALRHRELLRVYWTEDASLGIGTTSHGSEDPALVRVPAVEDLSWLRQFVARGRTGVLLPDRAARLMAAHLARGSDSSLYRLAVSGQISPRLHAELIQAEAGGRAYVRDWADALRRYCATRQDPGPLPSNGEPRP